MEAVKVVKNSGEFAVWNGQLPEKQIYQVDGVLYTGERFVKGSERMIKLYELTDAEREKLKTSLLKSLL